MRIRSITEADIPEMARVGAAAYVDDPIDAYLYPYRRAHPVSYRKAYSQNIKRMMETPGETHAIVAVLEASDEEWGGVPTIVGYGIWHRIRTSEHPNNREREKKSFGQRIKHALHPLVCLLTVLTNRAASARVTLRANLAMRFPCLRRDSLVYKSSYVKPTDFYKVKELVVHPYFQRRGIGTKMMQWGMQMAERESIPVCVRASTVGIPLYKELGFRPVGNWKCTLGKGMKRWIMHWDPPKNGHEIEHEREVEVDQAKGS